jgi:hypothetical protein
MSSERMLLELSRYVLPVEIVDNFDLIDLQESSGTLHLYLDESDIISEEHKAKSLSPNGFYDESTIKDFPLRDKKVVLHVRRRRWVDQDGKSHSRSWDLVASGTRYSKEFAFFLKESFGYLPDTSPIS